MNAISAEYYESEDGGMEFPIGLKQGTEKLALCLAVSMGPLLSLARASAKVSSEQE